MNTFEASLSVKSECKVTINPELEIDQYPLPKPEELFARLGGGKRFTKIDLTHAYQQMILEESSRKFVTINTHRGLYELTRLLFGVASAPALFQRVMDTVLQGIDKTICYVDDILVTGSTAEEHLQNLESVLERLQKYGIRAKRAKCLFMSEKVEYLGHRIDSEGLHTMASKVEAIKHGTPPQKHTGTQVLLGFTPLLWQISTWPSHSVASFESPAQSWTEVDLDKEVYGSICGCKETPSHSPCIGPL